MTLKRACLAVLIPMMACDMPPKHLGNESESNSGGGSESSGGGSESSGGGQCVDGDTKPSDDGCNQCECIDGEWACTLLGCGSESPPVCEDGDTMPAPDGCNTCSCLDGAWACTEIACPPGNGWFGDAILVCDPGAPEDALTISAVAIEANALVIDVSYGGGCAEHDFGLCWDGAFAESDPVQIQTFVSHDGHMDPCDAVPSEQLTFDLAPLQQAYQDGYQTQTGEITIILAGWPDAISYTF